MSHNLKSFHTTNKSVLLIKLRLSWTYDFAINHYSISKMMKTMKMMRRGSMTDTPLNVSWCVWNEEVMEPPSLVSFFRSITDQGFSGQLYLAERNVKPHVITNQKKCGNPE